ncbi:uncharacterized protein LOC143446753 isoform X2 [Clavelina lepadiformis]|uniref:uncharacterized protein LOC143446753 isoform X2 n=1 Tax=Clavelina lepadiformis TaxID=159417 RepID=UPI004043949A
MSSHQDVEDGLPMDGEFTNLAKESGDEWFDPAQSNTELNDLLQSLQNEPEEEIRIRYAPSTDYQEKLANFRNELENAESSSYLNEFEQVVKDDMLMIGSLSLEELELHEKKVQEQLLEEQKNQTLAQQQRKEDLAKLTESAKKEVWLDFKQQQREAALREELLYTRERLLNERMQKAFHLSESQLQRALELRKADVKSFFGDLVFADSQYGGSKGRRWRVEWTKTPQPIQIKLRCVRGIRDKVPKGRYVLMVSLYDRLGGHILRWSKLTGQQWGGATLPTYHDGHYGSSEMTLDQSVFTVLPAQWSVQPGMILVFELFLLRGSVSPTDKVVAWGCFPICDGQFQIIQGFYKLPMLRGFMDHRITKHTTIEHLIATDIDHWLANLYIQIIRLPRYLSGQKEYEVELQFSSALLSYPDRVQTAEEAVDGEKLPIHEVDQISNSDARSSSNISIDLDFKSSSVGLSSASKMATEKISYGDADSSILRRRKSDSKSHSSDKMETMSVNESEDERLIPVEGQEGMFYKLHFKNPVEGYAFERSATLVPKTPILNKRIVKPKLTHYENLDQHSFSVQPSFSSKGRLQRQAYERAEYVSRMFISEMGFSQWTTHEFWVTILLLMLLWFVRMYVHYCGQWLLLQALSLPVSSFVFFPYTVNLNYQSDLLSTGEQVGVVVLGPISNIIIQILLVLVSWISQMMFGSFPLLFSKFIMAYSLWTVFNPIAILIVDSALGRYANSAAQPIGDAFKLYWHFLSTEGSGVIGIPMTIFLYVIVIFIAVVILYLYFLKLHNNGRMMDVYHRLHGENEAFFLPYDLELSNQELAYIVKKAEQWRGEDGERRKVSVYDYIWDEDDLGTNTHREVTTHIAIHTLHLDGLRELYRHFLCLPDGAIVEVFGELGSAHLTPDVKTALLKRTTSIENMFASSASVKQESSIPITVLEAGSKKQSLNLPTVLERPLTSDSIRTRQTNRRDSSDGST